MNKKLDIRKNANVLFAINVIIFISLIFFKAFYTKLSYNSLIINVSLIINIVLFITGIVFNVLFIKDADKYDKPVILKIIIIVLGIYLLFNILGIPFFGKLISGDYTKINNKLSDNLSVFLHGRIFLYDIFIIYICRYFIFSIISCRSLSFL